MTDQRTRRLSELFELAIELPHEEREGFVRRHCAGDSALAAELAALLESDDEGTRDYLLGPLLTTSDAGKALPSPPGQPSESKNAHTHVGPYQIVRKIGEGGMGVVYLARQLQPIQRDVALKIVKPGVCSPTILRRFEAERQSLARMDHPGVARIIDAGSLENGNPYFVMDAIDGEPITRWCDERASTLEVRLRLFVDICDAVAHAHQKGILHRDLKPANVLVTGTDDAPQAKIIDFGLAVPALAEHSDQEGVLEVVGTGLYMSPEQASPDASSLDTRTDVYSLGALLFELATGTPPIPEEAFTGRSLEELRRVVESVTPHPPSDRVVARVDGVRARAQARGTTPRALSRRLRGDFDTVVAKALAKDRTERYGTVAQLAEDVRNILHSQPVTVHPGSIAHRTALMVRRQPLATAFLILAVVVGVAWIVGATRNTLRAEQERLTAFEITGFLADALTSETQFGVLDIAATRPPILEEVITRLDQGALRDQPRAEMNVRRALGASLHGLGKLDRARDQLRSALSTLEQLTDATLDERTNLRLALARLALDSEDLDGMAMLYDAEVALIQVADERIPGVGARLLDIMATLDNTTPMLLESRLERLEGVIASRAAGDPEDLLLVAHILASEGMWALYTDWGSVALPLFEQALQLRRQVLPDVHLEVVRALEWTAAAQVALGQTDEAVASATEALRLGELLVPGHHWLLARARSLLGYCLSLNGEHEDAEPLLIAGHRILRDTGGASSRSAVDALWRLVEHDRHTGNEERLHDARKELATAMAFMPAPLAEWVRCEGAFGREHGELLGSVTRVHEDLARELEQPGTRTDELNASIRTLFDLIQANLSADSPLIVLIARHSLSWQLPRTSSLLDARKALSDQALAALSPVVDKLPSEVVLAYARASEVALDFGDHGAGLAFASKGVDLARSTDVVRIAPRQACERARCQNLSAAGRMDQALQHSTRWLHALRDRFGHDNRFTAAFLDQHVQLCEQAGQVRFGAEALRGALVALGKEGRTSAPFTLTTWSALRSRRYSEELGDLLEEAASRIEASQSERARSVVVVALMALRARRYDDALEGAASAPRANAATTAELMSVRAMALDSMGRESDASATRKEMERFRIAAIAAGRPPYEPLLHEARNQP